MLFRWVAKRARRIQEVLKLADVTVVVDRNERCGNHFFLEFQAALKKRIREIMLWGCFVHAGVFSSNFVRVGLRLGHTKSCAMQGRI